MLPESIVWFWPGPELVWTTCALEPLLQQANLPKLHHDELAEARQADPQDGEGDLDFQERIAAAGDRPVGVEPSVRRRRGLGCWFSLESRYQRDALPIAGPSPRSFHPRRW